MKNINWNRILPFAVALVVFVVFTLFYCSPLLDGKVLQSGDVNNYIGASQEIREQKEATGEQLWWTNSMFGGMPSFQISCNTPSGNIRSSLETIFHGGMNQDFGPAGLVFAYLCGFFLMLICFGINPWISIIGSFALTLSTYFMLIIPAGHMTKASAIGCLAPVIGGFYALYQKKYWLGIPLITVFSIIGLNLHPQMTYYIGMLIGILFLVEIYRHTIEKRWKDFAIATAILAGCGILVFGSKVSWWQMNNEYLKETMRGGHSELVQEGKDNATKGLDIDYATAWSYGKGETMTLLIPNYQGCASGFDLGADSDLEKGLKKMGVPARSARQFCQGAPTYWGEKAFTSGPVYVGAIICLLFVLGLIIVPGPYKWGLLAATLLSVTLAWGKNFMGLTEFFYNNIPMYNKFRAVESILVIAEITIPLLGFLGIKRLMESQADSKMRRNIFIATGITAGVCLFVALLGSNFDVTSSYDAQWKGQVGDQIYDLILDQRHAMMTASAWKSLGFVILGGLALLLYFSKKETKSATTLLVSTLGILILVDMIPVNRHFFGNHNFVTPKDSKKAFAMQPWEEQILQDKSLDFRVLNTAANTFNDARTSYRLKSIGGYSAAKLRRYQDLIDAHISRNNMNVLNMLNTKYIVSREGQVMRNPEAMGNAWFVNEVKLVDNPNAESQALWDIDLKTTAVADRKFAEALTVASSAVVDSATLAKEQIVLTQYKPDNLVYSSQSANDHIAVFSEIYYPKGWHLYIDDKEAPLARVNYVLRAAKIPAGQHQIRMEFVPDSLSTDKISMAAIILALLISLGSFCWPVIQRVRNGKQIN